MKELLPSKLFQKKIEILGPLLRVGDVMYHFLDLQADVCTASLRDITRTAKIERRNKFDSVRIVVIKRGTAANFPHSRGHAPQGLFSTMLLVDSSETHPGYCRLKLSSSDSGNSNGDFGSNIYQKSFTIPSGLQSKIFLSEEYSCEIDCLGVLCLSFPYDRRWNRKKE